MAENRRGKENRFYFSRGQMVLLGGAFTAASLVIFFLGIFVGKSIEERKLLKKEEPLVKIPVKPGSAEPTAQAPQPPARDEITFNSDSLSGAANSLASAGENPRESKPAPAEKAKSETKQEKPAVAKAEAAPVKIADKVTPAEETAKAESVSATKDSGKVWRAQVNAFPDDRSAKQIVDRLKNKGYNAYVTEVQNKGKTWYRVNVGKYGSRDEAEKVVETLRSKENYPKAFAATK